MRNRSVWVASARIWLIVMAVSPTLASPAWSQSGPEYNLHAGDQLEVSVWGEEDLQRTVLIRPDWRFSFPLVGEINAFGRTVAEVETEMTEKIAVYIPEAVVTVALSGIDGNRIYVLGEVNDPGTYVMNPSLNVLQALSLAGGLTAFASVNDIKIIRGRGDNQIAIPFNYSDATRGRNLSQNNIDLQSGDLLMVP